MSFVDITEIASGVRELTDTELATVAGGGVWGDLGKIAGGALGNLAIGGLLGSVVGAGAVVLGIEIYNSRDTSVPPGSGVDTSIEDAAL